MAEPQSDSRGEARQSFFAKQQLLDAARMTFQLLAAVVRNATLYPEAHPILLTAADKLRGKIEELFVGRKQVAFYLVGGELFFETLSVPVDQSLSLFLEQFISRHVGGIVFKPGLPSQELIRFAALINKDPALFTGAGGVNETLEKDHIVHIELHRVTLVDKNVGSVIKEDNKKAAELYRDAVSVVKEMVEAVNLDKTRNLRAVNSVVQTMVDNVLENRDALMGLTSLKMYDEYTFSHSVNTAILAISLGSFLSFEKSQIAALGVAGLMHDIGKTTVPHEIINKPSKLTSEEWEQVKRHPIEGALLLADIPGVSKLAMIAAFEHHQYRDVKGYPPVEGKFNQHPFSQIVALADAYEALTAARVYYNSQMAPDEAVRILVSKRNTTFNPILVKAFVNMIGLFPIGTLLRFDTGEFGIVLHQTRDLMRPRVLLLSKFDGSEKETGSEISLLETEGGVYKRSITGTINPHEAKIDIKAYLT
ncbi:MAG TPA: HD domain-containing phosphohydrolase [Nitrospirota bacterium]|nr:HD domain-containing phosphohydrolase [Nitrospirota bacterium]